MSKRWNIYDCKDDLDLTYTETFNGVPSFPHEWTDEQKKYALGCRKILASIILQCGIEFIETAQKGSMIDDIKDYSKTGIKHKHPEE